MPIDRRALANHRELDLSESQIRGAIQTLERVGFLERMISQGGSSYRRKGDELHRKPILFVFSSEYAAAFKSANSSMRTKREKRHLIRRPIERQPLISPKSKISLGKGVIMGEIRPPSNNPHSPLEIALARLERLGGFAIETSGLNS
jgi:hypothetical protein